LGRLIFVISLRIRFGLMTADVTGRPPPPSGTGGVIRSIKSLRARRYCHPVKQLCHFEALIDLFYLPKRLNNSCAFCKIPTARVITFALVTGKLKVTALVVCGSLLYYEAEPTGFIAVNLKCLKPVKLYKPYNAACFPRASPKLESSLGPL
jgi:hypothetical protein